jgi:hypothetical protein
VTIPSNWPELTLAVALALLLALRHRRSVARVAWSILHAIVEDREVQAQFVDRPRRIVRLVVFLVTAASLASPR